MQRRHFIRLTAGGTVAAALGSGCSSFETPPSALTAWQGPSAKQELRRWVLSYALLAPNPHNMQPWIADLSRPGEIELRFDSRRLLPETDPLGRQIVMGGGCFLELLALAAAQRGFAADVTPFPQGEGGQRLGAAIFAHVKLRTDSSLRPDPLFEQVLRRRTERRAYDPARPLQAAQIEALQAALQSPSVSLGLAGRSNADQTEQTRLRRIKEIARQAWSIEMRTEAAMMESMRVLRFGASEIDQHRDGIAITAPLLVLLARSGLMDRAQYPGAESFAIKSQIEDFDAITASTPSYLWLTTQGNGRRHQLDAGRAYARLNLAATAMGLAMHPNQQALQEYPQVAAPYRAIHAELGSEGQTVQMLARLGHLPAGEAHATASPRRGLESLQPA